MTPPVSSGSRARVLVSVHNADRGDVGESWSNHKWIEGLSQSFDISLVTLAYPRSEPLSEQLPGVTLHEVARLPVVTRFKRLDSMAQPSFMKLYRRARRLARSLHKEGRVDLLHSLGPMAIRYPSPFAGLDLPYIHGPIGGSVKAPTAMGLSAYSERWYVRLRQLDHVRFRHDRWLKRTMRDARRVLAVGPYVADYFADWSPDRAVYMSETGAERVGDPRELRDPEVPHILFVGRMVPSKGVHLLIDALARLKALTPYRATLVGDGLLRTELEQQVEQAGLTDRVRFTGRIPRDEVFALYADADIFAFPSLEEASGNVVFEAMSQGLPCVVAASGGPAAVIDATSGAAVPARERNEFVDLFAAALLRFLTDAELRRTCGEAARQEVESVHLWPRKIEAMRAVYDDVLAETR